MGANKIPFISLPQTGFPYPEGGQLFNNAGFSHKATSAIFACLASVSIAGTMPAPSLNKMFLKKPNEVIIPSPSNVYVWPKAASNLNDAKILSVNEKLKETKQFIGLNVLELAEILQVSRPTIYEWMEKKEIKLREKNEERLDKLHKIAVSWHARKLGRLERYLYKPLYQYGASLFSLLKNNDLYLDEINQYLNEIGQAMKDKRQAVKSHEALLTQHGFEPMSKEAIEDSFNDIGFMDE